LTLQGGIEYNKIAEIKGPLVVVDGVENAMFDELVEIQTTEGEKRLGKVLEVGNGKAVVQVFEKPLSSHYRRLTTPLSLAHEGVTRIVLGKV